MPTKVCGIDFSGADNAGRTIWVTRAAVTPHGLLVEQCCPVADLPRGSVKREKALPSLVAWLADAGPCLCGCDMPFVIPEEVMPRNNWDDFVRDFAACYRDSDDFRDQCRQKTGGREFKRPSEKEAKAPFSSYNLRLYRQTFHGVRDVLAPLVLTGRARAIPFQRPAPGVPWLIEVCPATFLREQLPPGTYKGTGRGPQAARQRLVERLVDDFHVDVGPLPDLPGRLIANTTADGIDSLIAALIARRALRHPEALQRPTTNQDGRIFH